MAGRKASTTQTAEQKANAQKMQDAAKVARDLLTDRIKELTDALDENKFISADKKSGKVVEHAASTLAIIAKAKEAMITATAAVSALKAETGTKGLFPWLTRWTRTKAYSSAQAGNSEKINKLEKETDKLIVNCTKIIAQFETVRKLTLDVNRELTTAAIALQNNVNEAKSETEEEVA